MTPSERRRLISLILATSLLAGLVGGALTVSLINQTGRQISDIVGTVAPTKQKIVLEESSAIIDTVKKVSDSVVSITTSTNTLDFFTGRTIEQKGGGTGFILTSDG